MRDRQPRRRRRFPRPLSPHRQRVIYLGPWPRRLLASALIVIAVFLATRPPHSPSAAAEPEVTVVVATRPLPPGHRLADGDVRLTRWPSRLVPVGALRERARAIGHPLAAAVPRGGLVLDVSIAGPGLARALAGPGATAVPVRVAEPALAGLLHPGDAVDVVAHRSGGGSAIVAARVRVLLVLSDATQDAPIDGFTVVVAAGRDTARRLALVPQEDSIALILRPE